MFALIAVQAMIILYVFFFFDFCCCFFIFVSRFPELSIHFSRIGSSNNMGVKLS